ncbi:hypothetical protein HN695_05875 [Candidatus Woesearchaeota archaeon]|jgi:hypothetical protein|nr:hypothetical protein [Candidatus Woesearchaeota archaeon]MBT5272591.1 hypothetical protein [Candidatus Woesearchaeota archaeon]MBT6040552.1 hypothetical protein [Candidatus Woesearchaeota archaeon]MBT6337143.1 hypothetical protein [Candidatus Woesearchaeota archaeon]MBT7927837.1 hypothetical protein [Candidatus Woesearchaeota archaeon]
MVQAKVVGGGFGNHFGRRISGIGFGLVLLIIGVLFLLRDLGYITTKISFWTYFFLVIGAWWVLGRLFR